MASLGPTSGLKGSLAPWRKRQPRKLNYLSCAFCRNAKVKCIPLPRELASRKCTRCSQRGLACSAPQRKTMSRVNPIQHGYFQSPPAPIVTNSNIKVHDALAVLSLQHILGQAVNELLIIGRQQLMPMKGMSSWASHGQMLDDIVSRYRSLLDDLHIKLCNINGQAAQALVKAAIDIMYQPRFFDDVESLKALNKILSQYKAQGHHGIATVLQMSRLRYSTNQNKKAIEDALLDRDAFIDSLGEVFHRLNIQGDIGVDLTKTQLFMPAELFRIPGLAKAIQDDGRIDCLGRPVGHIFHDNKVGEQFGFAAFKDGKDVLGRSRLHIACSLSAKQQDLCDLKVVPRHKWFAGSCDMLGLDPLHVAAICGNIEVYEMARDCGTGEISQDDPTDRVMDQTGRTCLHWASRFGHLDLVEFLLQIYSTDTTWLKKVLTSIDNDHDTPIHLAARNGHLDVVERITRVTDWQMMHSLFPVHTPFWAATSGRHLEIMKLLAPFSDVDAKEGGDLTPLAEAARQGFWEGVDYLAQLESVSVNSTNYQFNSAVNQSVAKTPLDLALEGRHGKCSGLLEEHGALTFSDCNRKSVEAGFVAQLHNYRLI